MTEQQIITLVVSCLVYLVCGGFAAYWYMRAINHVSVEVRRRLAHEAAVGILGGCMLIGWIFLLPYAYFFEVKKYSEMTFKSNSVEKSEDGFIVRGELKVKDTTNKVEIPFTFEKKKKGGVFKGVMKVHTKNLGIDYPSIVSQDETEDPNVIITIEVPVTK